MTLIIAGGGTGGHVFPGIALAEAFLALVPGGFVSFVGTQGGLEARAVPARGYEIDFVPSGQVRGKGAGGLMGVARTVKGIAVAFSVLRRRRPDLVFGVGGYASVPVSVAASLTGVPLFLQEQNAVPGRANRMLGRMARKVYAGFSGAASYFPPGRTEVAGNPVRREVVDARAYGTTGRPDSRFTVFALGGSQGARAINTLVLEMGRRVKQEGCLIAFVLQTGSHEFASMDAIVRQEVLPIEPFPFTDRIGEVFARCDAVLMRAGALSIAEASLFGKPCILIPYPHAADRHQEKNAREFCAGGAGVWMRQEEATGERILSTLISWAADPEGRAAAGEAAVRFSRPDAAAHIVRSALREIGKGPEAPRV
ncbi:MAG TPA: undecaprenyldiphospho-muramoylpentapeptide beta-N-acetylglucosaminyltransferase [Candidatus Limnocylindrales bacterium]|nr:undecaprenyldiphospho-muramoylpentapeptide beta-N-acetylglucosaminyltransferase [Candidatus Limnocylindrales bacterium]